MTNGLSAEFGRTGGGVITSATRSGTNTLHGSGYVYMRRDRFNANSWTNKRNGVAKGKEHIDQYGFTLGGPVMRDRMFFFVNVERSNSLTPDNVIRTVPTALQRAGDFSQTRTSNGQLITIYDPLTTRSNAAGGFIRDPFPGNMIPANRIDAIAKAIMEHYPTPTNDNATQNFVWSDRARARRCPSWCGSITRGAPPVVWFVSPEQQRGRLADDQRRLSGSGHERRGRDPRQRSAVVGSERHDHVSLKSRRRGPFRLHAQPFHDVARHAGARFREASASARRTPH